MKTWLWISLIAALLAGLIYYFGVPHSDIEEPSYQTLSVDSPFEVRLYPPRIVAEVTVTGERDKAINNGFRLLADFIFGNNKAQSSISMTAPVSQQPNQPIAMTAPVTQSPTPSTEPDSWTVRFFMPKEFSLDTLPTPNNSKVKLLEIPQQKFVVITFSGSWNDSVLEQKLQLLKQYLENNNLQALSPDPTYAFYNPPWTLPFLRRNEIMINIL